MNQIRVIFASIRVQLLQRRGRRIDIFSYIFPVLGASVFAWIARQSNNPTVGTYVLVGVPLMSLSGIMIFNVGWALSQEVAMGTLEFALISPASMITILIGKTFSQIITCLAGAIISLVTVLVISHKLLTVAYIGLLPFSLLLVLVSVSMTSLFFAPLMTLVQGRGGFFNAFTPFIGVLSGFIFPINLLPSGLRIIARLLPNSWAMDDVWQSIQGNVSAWQVVGSWGICILVSATWFVVIYFLFGIVEKRIRITGTLGTY